MSHPVPHGHIQSGRGGPWAVAIRTSGTEPSVSLPCYISIPVHWPGPAMATPLHLKTLRIRELKLVPGSHGGGRITAWGHLPLSFLHHGCLRQGPGTTILPGRPAAIWSEVGGDLPSIWSGVGGGCWRRTYFSLLNMMNSFRTVSKHCWRCPFCQRAERQT